MYLLVLFGETIERPLSGVKECKKKNMGTEDRTLLRFIK